MPNSTKIDRPKAKSQSTTTTTHPITFNYQPWVSMSVPSHSRWATWGKTWGSSSVLVWSSPILARSDTKKHWGPHQSLLNVNKFKQKERIKFRFVWRPEDAKPNFAHVIILSAPIQNWVVDSLIQMLDLIHCSYLINFICLRREWRKGYDFFLL